MDNKLNLNNFINYLANSAETQKTESEQIQLGTNNAKTNNTNKEDTSIFRDNSFFDEAIDDIEATFEQLSAAFPNILGPIVDAFDGESKDGQIGETKQVGTGNCWLLSGINALSYTEEGRQIIKDSLEYCDGYTMVHLKGYGTVVVQDKDVAQTKGSLQYSSGDDDMIIFELAIEQIMDEIANGEIMVDPDAPWFIENSEDLEKTKWGSSSTEGGWVNELIYYVTGKEGKNIKDKVEMKENLQAFEANGNKDLAMGASTSEDSKVKDINGDTVKLAGNHAYSIKEVKDGVVTVINPWDSSKEIKLDIDTFCEAFSSIDVTDLSDKNPRVSNISRTYKIDAEGNKRFVFYDPYKEVQETRDSKTGDVKQRDFYNAKGEKTKQENWEYNKKGEKTAHTISNFKNGKLTIVDEYTFDPKTGKNTAVMRSHYNENEKKIAEDEYGYAENGRWGVQKRKNYDPETGKHTSTANYSYNDDGTYESNTFDTTTGKNTRRDKYDSDGKLVQTIIFNYDPESGEYLGYEIIDH